MPNFQTRLLSPLEYPHVEDDVRFEWVAKNKAETLILTKTQDEVFFIKQIERENNTLVKGDKLAKPSCVKVLQEALQKYQKASNSHPIYSNINSRKNRIEQDSQVLKDVDFFALKYAKFCKDFKNIHVDIGFGSGRHLLFKAKQSLDDLFIGIEIHKPSIEQVVKLCKLKELKNVIVIDFDARVLMEFFESNQLSTIFIHFPIPWDKKPHRRVISDEFLSQATRVLKKGGKIELRTDSDNFFNYSLELFLKPSQTHVQIRKNKDIEISSKYEDRWKRLEKDIYDLTLINQEVSPVHPTPIPLTFDFKVENNNFKKETILKEGYFVHFQICYEIDEENFVWKVAFGDTACVQNCYVIVKDKKARYFPRNVYATKHNINAHKIICERLSS